MDATYAELSADNAKPTDQAAFPSVKGNIFTTITIVKTRVRLSRRTRERW